MYRRKIPIETNCGLDLIGEVLYGKWKIKLLYYISRGYKRPNELHKKIPEAAPRVLNIQLKQLVEHELVSKYDYGQLPLKVEYSLTDFGCTLLPIITLMGEWGDIHKTRLCQVIEKSWNINSDNGSNRT